MVAVAAIDVLADCSVPASSTNAGLVVRLTGIGVGI